MPSFDVSSEMNWQELDNAINQAIKEVGQRYDFKTARATIELDQKLATVTLTVSQEDKLDALIDLFQNKLIKRGLSLLAFTGKPQEPSLGGGVRLKYEVQNGISKEKGKEIIAALKETKLKIQSQIQDEQVRVSGKNRDDLQTAISFLKQKQDDLGVSMTFGNFRE